MNRLPSGYLVDSDGGRRVLTAPGVVYRPDNGEAIYRRTPVMRFSSSVPISTVALVARLDQLSRTSVGMERKRALEQLASIFREWRKS